MFNYEPGYAIFNAEERQEQKGAYFMLLDTELGIGMFVIDGLSINLYPSLLYIRDRSFNSIGEEDLYQSVFIGLQAGATYYLRLKSRLAVAIGLKAGLTIIPGLDRINDDVSEEDKSLDATWNLEPNAAIFYFLTDNLAPYFQVGTRFTYYREIKDTSGSKLQYPDSYSIFDDVELNFSFGLGLKVFLPPPLRSVETDHKSLPEYSDIMG